MIKPNKLPPPPPPPPRNSSPSSSYHSLPQQFGCACYGGGGSEYAESVCSVPFSTRSLQYPIKSDLASACCNERCCSKSLRSCCCRSACGSIQSISCHQSAHCTMSPAAAYKLGSHSPCSPASSCQRHSDVVDSPVQQHCLDHQRPLQQPRRGYRPLPPPPPAQDIDHHQRQQPPQPARRSRYSISPKPTLKRDHSKARPFEKCKPTEYKRHIENHIDRIFKYLREREQRRRYFESEARANPNENALETLITKKETNHLRSLRTPISKEDFKELKKLGSGYIGNVSLVEQITKGKKSGERSNLFAMKKLRKDKVYKLDHIAHVIAERDMLAEADNEWIVKFFYSFQDNVFLYLILEFIPGGDMMHLLCLWNVFSEQWARFYVAEISAAIQSVHDMNFIHRDIKPDNILIDARGHIKLTDFGLCTGNRFTHDARYYRDDNRNLIDQDEQLNNPIEHPTITRALIQREIEHAQRRKELSIVGSPNYIAPEVLRKAFFPQEHSDERLCDWWSVGVILYEMVVGCCPFIDVDSLRTDPDNFNPDNDTPDQVQRRILNWKEHLAFPGEPRGPPELPDSSGRYHEIREDTKALIRGLLCDPTDRLCQNGLQDIKFHPFFRGIDWNNLRRTTAPYIPELKDADDTQHFDPNSGPPELDIVGGCTTNTKMGIDFTLKTYWTKPFG